LSALNCSFFFISVEQRLLFAHTLLYLGIAEDASPHEALLHPNPRTFPFCFLRVGFSPVFISIPAMRVCLSAIAAFEERVVRGGVIPDIAHPPRAHVTCQPPLPTEDGARVGVAAGHDKQGVASTWPRRALASPLVEEEKGKEEKGKKGKKFRYNCSLCTRRRQSIHHNTQFRPPIRPRLCPSTLATPPAPSIRLLR
jgi:hypothetical protein